MQYFAYNNTIHTNITITKQQSYIRTCNLKIHTMKYISHFEKPIRKIIVINCSPLIDYALVQIFLFSLTPCRISVY